MTEHNGRSGPSIFLPLALLLVATALIRVFGLDMRLAARFHDSQNGWFLGSNWLVQLLYHYGTWPSIIVAIVAGIVWVTSAFNNRLRSNRQLAMFVALTMVVGPGLLVNLVFKEHYGRPRPREVTEFGGHREFAPVLEPHVGEGGQSFPSGHAAMGFFWLSLGIFYCERNRRLALASVVLGLVHGVCMGIGRIAQGAHWLSDILWAAGMVYVAAWAVYRAGRLSPACFGPKQNQLNATE